MYPRSGSADRGSNRSGSRNTRTRSKRPDSRPKTVLATRPGQDTLQIVRTNSLTGTDIEMSKTGGFQM